MRRLQPTGAWRIGSVDVTGGRLDTSRSSREFNRSSCDVCILIADLAAAWLPKTNRHMPRQREVSLLCTADVYGSKVSRTCEPNQCFLSTSTISLPSQNFHLDDFCPWGSYMCNDQDQACGQAFRGANRHHRGHSRRALAALPREGTLCLLRCQAFFCRLCISVHKRE